MVCMMSKEQVAIFALLVTLTWACQFPEQCNLADVPAVNATYLQGRWYGYKTTCLPPGYEDVDGYVADIVLNDPKNGTTTLTKTEHIKLKNGTQICSGAPSVCTMDPQKASCITDLPYVKQVVLAMDPQKYLVLLGQHMTGQSNFTYISIAVRNPATAATVIAENQVLEKISTLCGNTVTSPNYFITLDSSSLRTC
ncbi:hypothetical protein ACOMHN_056803 [Nucella lapillus]